MPAPKRLLAPPLLALLLALASCGDSTGPEPILGTYALESFNGRPVPAVIYKIDFMMEEMVESKITLNPDLSYDGMEVKRYSEYGYQQDFDTIRFSGFYQVNEDTIRFTTDAGEDIGSGVLPGRILTRTFREKAFNGLWTLVYRKETSA